MARSMQLRGLASLIPEGAFDLDPPKVEDNKEAVRTVPIDQIVPNPEQPRTVFHNEQLQSLSDSIAVHGVLNPIVVRRDENGGYILIAGERRLRASGLAGLTEIPVVIRQAETAQVQLELALVENLQRSDLDPIESAKGFQRLIDVYGYTQDEVAKSVSKNRATVANAVRLLKLPAFVLDAVRDNRISAGHARTLLPLAEDEESLRMTLARVIAQSLSVRATERLVADKVRVTAPISTRQRNEQSRDRTLSYATRLLQEALHTAVQIKPGKGGSGKIQIDYADAEDLERLITMLRGDA